MILDEKLFEEINKYEEDLDNKKLLFRDFIEYLDSIDNSYFDFSKIRGEKDNYKLFGYRYLLTNPLTQEQKDYLLKFDNVEIGDATYRYAPEIKHDSVIIINRKIPIKKQEDIEENLREGRLPQSPYSHFKNYRRGFNQRTLQGRFSTKWDERAKELGKIENDAYNKEVDEIQDLVKDDSVKLAKETTRREDALNNDIEKFYTQNSEQQDTDDYLNKEAQLSGRILANQHLNWSANDFNRVHGIKENFKLGSEDTQVIRLANPYNYTIFEYRIDNKNKTFEKGDFIVGKPDKVFHNRKEIMRLIDTLEKDGYKEIGQKKEDLEFKDLKEENLNNININDENLEDTFEEKDPEALEDSPNIENNGIATQLINAINLEWETIRDYNDLIVNAESYGYSDIADVIRDIVNEENIHVGQLQSALQTISPNIKSIEKGQEEADRQLDNKEEVKDLRDYELDI